MIVCVDMDYSSSPIWVGRVDEYGDIGFANDTLSKYNFVLSIGLLHSLELFRSTWEHYHDSPFRSLFDDGDYPGKFLMRETLDTLMFLCASQIKKEQPKWRVFYGSMYDYKRKELK